MASLEVMWYGLFVVEEQFTPPVAILSGGGLTVLQAQLGEWDNLNHLLVCEKTSVACIVDPFSGEYWNDVCIKNGWELNLCILTHSHWDHTKGVEELLRVNPSCQIWLHENEALRGWSGPDTDRWSHEQYSSVNFEIGALSFNIHLTPGHTPGHVSIIGNGVYISGDCLFLGRCGRTDLFGGDLKSQYESLLYLKSVLRKLPNNWLVLPGHQYLLADGSTPTTSTIEELLKNNLALIGIETWDNFKKLHFLSFDDNLAEKARRQRAQN